MDHIWTIFGPLLGHVLTHYCLVLALTWVLNWSIIDPIIDPLLDHYGPIIGPLWTTMGPGIHEGPLSCNPGTVVPGTGDQYPPTTQYPVPSTRHPPPLPVPHGRCRTWSRHALTGQRLFTRLLLVRRPSGLYTSRTPFWTPYWTQRKAVLRTLCFATTVSQKILIYWFYGPHSGFYGPIQWF